MNNMTAMLRRHGDRFAGSNPNEAAQQWIDAGFTPEVADQWCEIGVWDAGVAETLRDHDLTPDAAKDAAERLFDENGADEYTDGDPIYSVCNNDTDIEDLIDAANQK